MGGASRLRKGGSARRGLFEDSGEDNEKGEQELELGQHRPPAVSEMGKGDEGGRRSGDEQVDSRGQAVDSRGQAVLHQDLPQGTATDEGGCDSDGEETAGWERWREMKKAKEEGRSYKSQLDGAEGRQGRVRSLRAGAAQGREDRDKDGNSDEGDAGKSGGDRDDSGGRVAATAEGISAELGARLCEETGGGKPKWGRKGSDAGMGTEAGGSEGNWGEKSQRQGWMQRRAVEVQNGMLKGQVPHWMMVEISREGAAKRQG